MKALIATLLLAASLDLAHADNKDYRAYLTSIDGFGLWFRIGSYSLNVDGSATPVDLYFRDSDIRPDGKPALVTPYPNAFGLFCVWRDKDGGWHHKELAGAARCTFHQITSVETSRIKLELQPKFRITIEPGEDFAARMKRGEEVNKPFTRILEFQGGAPTLIEPTTTKAEQDDAGQSATAPQSKPEEKDKPQPEPKPAPR